MKLHLTIDLDPETLARDVQAFLASVKFVLRGIFPGSKLRVTIENDPTPCEPATHSSTLPPPN